MRHCRALDIPLADIKRLLDFTTLPNEDCADINQLVDEQIARRAGGLGRTYRRSHLLASADLVIGATAQELSAELATANVRHFPMFEGLEPPY